MHISVSSSVSPGESTTLLSKLARPIAHTWFRDDRPPQGASVHTRPHSVPSSRFNSTRLATAVAKNVAGVDSQPLPQQSDSLSRQSSKRKRKIPPPLTSTSRAHQNAGTNVVAHARQGATTGTTGQSKRTARRGVTREGGMVEEQETV